MGDMGHGGGPGNGGGNGGGEQQCEAERAACEANDECKGLMTRMKEVGDDKGDKGGDKGPEMLDGGRRLDGSSELLGVVGGVVDPREAMKDACMANALCAKVMACKAKDGGKDGGHGEGKTFDCSTDEVWTEEKTQWCQHKADGGGKGDGESKCADVMGACEANDLCMGLMEKMKAEDGREEAMSLCMGNAVCAAVMECREKEGGGKDGGKEGGKEDGENKCADVMRACEANDLCMEYME